MALLTNRVRTWQYFITMVIYITVVFSCSTTNQIQQQKKAPVKLADSLLVDTDGNKYPVKILAENKVWMTANLKLNIPGSYCYEN
ncbi:MAG: hypothetical protein ABUT20_58080, partial [Bacteroidota bacterium]